MRVYGVPFECLDTYWFYKGYRALLEIRIVDESVLDEWFMKAMDYAGRRGFPVPHRVFPHGTFVAEESAPLIGNRAFIALANLDGNLRVEEFHDVQNAYRWLADPECPPAFVLQGEELRAIRQAKGACR